MKKYFRVEQSAKISLQDYLIQVEKEYKGIEEEIKKHSIGGYVTTDIFELLSKLEIKKREISFKFARIKHIYQSLGDIQISEDMIETICETFDTSKCRYGTICLKKETVQAMFELSEIFPELSKDALISISREYIKDLFDEYSLLETLSIMLSKDGKEDATFEKFIEKVKECADKEDRKYSKVAWYIRIHCGEYPYDFVRHFEQFVKEHHISWERFCECLPGPELILKDYVELKEIRMKSKECWSSCDPISYQMLGDYLDGDTELSYFDEQPAYCISISGEKSPTIFTKTQFLESIKKHQKTLKKGE